MNRKTLDAYLVHQMEMAILYLQTSLENHRDEDHLLCQSVDRVRDGWYIKKAFDAGFLNDYPDRDYFDSISCNDVEHIALHRLNEFEKGESHKKT